MLLQGIAFDLAFSTALIYLPPLQVIFGTRTLGLPELALLAIFPFIVWVVDEIWRAVERGLARRAQKRSQGAK